MLHPGQKLYIIWFLLTVLIFWIKTSNAESDEKTLNLKIGFDLSKKSAQALKIQELEGTEKNINDFKPRAVDEEEILHEKKSPQTKNYDSSSDDDENTKKKPGRTNEDSSVESQEKSKEDVQSDEKNDSDEDNRRSTRGLKPAEYEPEDSPKIHGRDVDSDSDVGRYRYKRGAEIGKKKRRFNKKVRIPKH